MEENKPLEEQLKSNKIDIENLKNWVEKSIKLYQATVEIMDIGDNTDPRLIESIETFKSEIEKGKRLFSLISEEQTELISLVSFVRDNLEKSKAEGNGQWKNTMFGGGWMSALCHVEANFINQQPYQIPKQIHNAFLMATILESIFYSERDGYITIKTDSTIYNKLKQLVDENVKDKTK